MLEGNQIRRRDRLLARAQAVHQPAQSPTRGGGATLRPVLLVEEGRRHARRIAAQCIDLTEFVGHQVTAGRTFVAGLRANGLLGLLNQRPGLLQCGQMPAAANHQHTLKARGGPGNPPRHAGLALLVFLTGLLIAAQLGEVGIQALRQLGVIG